MKLVHLRACVSGPAAEEVADPKIALQPQPLTAKFIGIRLMKA